MKSPDRGPYDWDDDGPVEPPRRPAKDEPHAASQKVPSGQDGAAGQYNTMAIVALALGVLGLVSCALLGAAAIPCANKAMREIQRTGERGRELAMAGLVLGSLGLTLWVVLLSVMAVLFPW